MDTEMLVGKEDDLSDIYYINWEERDITLAQTLEVYYRKNHLVDVVLKAENQEILAHSLVLSACSTYFQKFFEGATVKNNKRQYVVIQLLGIPFTQLKMVIDYMYTGQAVVPADEMDDFLQIGRQFQIASLLSSIVENFGEERANSSLSEPVLKPRSFSPSNTSDDSAGYKVSSINRKLVDSYDSLSTNRKRRLQESSQVNEKEVNTSKPCEKIKSSKQPRQTSPLFSEQTDEWSIPLEVRFENDDICIVGKAAGTKRDTVLPDVAETDKDTRAAKLKAYRTQTATMMRPHLIRTKSHNLQCTKCKTHFRNVLSYDVHNCKPGQEKCGCCGEAFKNRVSMKNHERWCRKEKKLTCLVYNPYSSTQTDELRTNLVGNNLTVFSCGKCHSTFTGKVELFRHVSLCKEAGGELG